MAEIFPKTYIVVLNYNDWENSRECLESILQIEYPNYEILFVDNASSDHSVEKLKEWAPANSPITIIETGKNLGYAGGNNAGIKYAQNKKDFGFVWILNNDVVVTKEALSLMVRHLQEAPMAGICGCMVLDYNHPDLIGGLGGYYLPWFGYAPNFESGKTYRPDKLKDYQNYEKKISYVNGSSVLVSADFLDSVGLMSEEYFLFFEELDWAIRARKQNFLLALEPRAIVFHKYSGTIGKEDKLLKGRPTAFNRIFDRYYTRSRLLFTWKYCPQFLPTVYLSIFGDVLTRLKNGAFENLWIMMEELARHLLFLYKTLIGKLRKP